MEAYEHNRPYCTNNKGHGAGSSLSLSIFAFKGLSEVDKWYDDDPFGETQVNNDLFPSLRRIGEDRPAKVNRAFFQIFLDLLNSSGFKLEVEKAVTVDHKEILFTGHSSGSAIASFATLWMLDEYTRKRGMKFPIGCVTFGTPLIGDDTLSHAVQRERWAGHFTHFVMQYDIVPRMMLAPKASIQEHLPNLFKQKVNTYTSRKTLNDQLTAEQAAAFFENVMINASTVASHDAFDLMEPTNSQKMSSVNFVNGVSPYRPFGKYVFCTGDEIQGSITPRQLLVVENPNAVLQLLFYFLQLPNEVQDLAEFALNSLAENLSYGEELNKNGMQLQNTVYLKDLNELLLRSDGTTYDAVRTRNKALFELSTRAKLCLKAVEEAEKRKKNNEKLVKRSMRKYTPERPKPGENIIEDILDNIRDYKEMTMDYYEAFKLHEKHHDFYANVHRLELAKIYDVIIDMVIGKDLPDEFEVWQELVDQATLFRRLTEPLDIANYYRHSRGGYGYMAERPERYEFTQRWYEHANVMRFTSISESNFIAEVEELKVEVEGRTYKTLEAVNEKLENIKHKVLMWKSDDKIPNEDVYWGESLLSLENYLPKDFKKEKNPLEIF